MKNIQLDTFAQMKVFEESQVKARIGWQSLTTKEYLKSGDYGLVGGTNLVDGRIDWESIPYVNKWRYDQDKFIQLQSNDILISKDGTIGKIAFVDSLPFPATLNSGVYVIRPKGSSYEPSFMYHLLNSYLFEDFIEKLAAGSTISHLYQKDLKNFIVHIPSNLEEQKAIAEALSDIDNFISNTKALLIKKKQVISGVKNQIFSINKNWITEKIGKLARLYQPETIPAKYFSQVGYPVYGANGVIGAFSRFNHDTSQILISCRGNVGTVNFSESKAWINGNAMVVNIDSNDQLDKRFFYHLLAFQDFSKIATGSGQPQIVRGPLEVFDVNLPNDLAEQQRLGRILDDLDHEISSIETELNKYLDIKKAMMNDLLTGKVRLV